jgi:hypothetical protein
MLSGVMTGFVILLAFILLVGPLAVLFGADSRPVERDDRGWWPGSPREPARDRPSGARRVDGAGAGVAVARTASVREAQFPRSGASPASQATPAPPPQVA